MATTEVATFEQLAKQLKLTKSAQAVLATLIDPTAGHTYGSVDDEGWIDISSATGFRRTSSRGWDTIPHSHAWKGIDLLVGKGLIETRPVGDVYRTGMGTEYVPYVDTPIEEAIAHSRENSHGARPGKLLQFRLTDEATPFAVALHAERKALARERREYLERQLDGDATRVIETRAAARAAMEAALGEIATAEAHGDVLPEGFPTRVHETERAISTLGHSCRQLVSTQQQIEEIDAKLAISGT